MNLIEKIKASFGHRTKPKTLVVTTSLFQNEMDEINSFATKQWFDITCEDTKQSGDAIYHFSGEAFCYFLPGFLVAGVKTGNRALMPYDYIIDSLDRSPIVEYWDTQFISRWSLLTSKEIEAVEEWLLWFVEEEHEPWGNTFDRCFDTLELLRLQKEALEL